LILWRGDREVQIILDSSGVSLFFPDLPDIFCLDELHNKLRGVPLEEAVSRYGAQSESFARVSWRHENFITATWQGIRVFDFPKSYNRLKEILGEKFPRNPNWQPYQPTPQTLKEIVETLSWTGIKNKQVPDLMKTRVIVQRKNGFVYLRLFTSTDDGSQEIGKIFAGTAKCRFRHDRKAASQESSS
jgi:hypothetical protein